MSCKTFKRPSDAAVARMQEQLSVDAVGQVLRNGLPIGRACKAGYIKVKFAGGHWFAHRIVWLLTFGSWPELGIDHINGDRADNRPSNLRVASQAHNCQNKGRALPTNQSTGLLGTNLHKSNGRRFRAQIWFEGKNHHIGYFDTAEQAHAAYLSAKATAHPGFVPERFT